MLLSLVWRLLGCFGSRNRCFEGEDGESVGVQNNFNYGIL